MGLERHTPHVCVAVVPRERLSTTASTLASVAQHSPGVDLLWIDNGHSTASRREAEAAAPHAQRITAPRWARPGAMHNLAIDASDSDYIVLLDNDVTVSEGWLDALVRCAEETGADAVSPTILRATPVRTSVHFGGGSVFCEVEKGRLVISDVHDHPEMLPTGGSATPRHRTGLCELHCVLLRRRALQRVGNLDPSIANRELIEWFLRLHALGGTTWAEPSSVVTYSAPPPFTLRDRVYFLLRWSERWTDRSFERFESIYGLPFAEDHRAWTRRQRHLGYSPVFDLLARVIGRDHSEGVREYLFTPIEVLFNRAFVATWRMFDRRVW